MASDLGMMTLTDQSEFVRELLLVPEGKDICDLANFSGVGMEAVQLVDRRHD